MPLLLALQALNAIKDPLEVGTVSGQGKVRTPIPAITARHSLFPTSFARIPISIPYGLPATSGGNTGLPSSRSVTRTG